MMIHQILHDTNYIYILQDRSGKMAVVDPTAAAPVLDFFNQKNLKLDFILNTHHHYDHVDGNVELKQKFNAQIIASAKDSHRIPGFIKSQDHGVVDGENWTFGSHVCRVIENPGHTVGAISFYFESEKALFSGDTLFSYGCGRLFEGSPEMMFESLRKLKALPDETHVYCGHEYAQRNLEYCLSLWPQNTEIANRLTQVRTKRSQGQFVVPTLLGDEKRLNPFLNTENLSEWAHRRELRNLF